jgi:hypothetical protein
VPEGRSITVQSAGQVRVKPDRLQVVLGVSLARSDPGEALAALSERLNLLAETLDQAGVPALDRRTTDLSLQPEWNRRGEGEGAGEHRGSASITVTVADFALASRLVADAGGAIGDSLTVSGLKWLVADPAPARVEARRAAVEDATTIARQLAADAGVTLGPLRSILEPPGAAVGPGRLLARRRSGQASAPRLEEGETVESVAVEMTWDITD